MNPVLSSLAPGIKYLIARVTNRCNASCTFCLNTYYQSETFKKPPENPELSIEEYARIARNLKGLVLLNLSGGEPYLREDLDEIAAQFITHAGVSYLSSPTNGTFPERVERVTKSILTKHAKITFKVNISIDGVGGRHDEIRGIRDGYAKALVTAERLQPLKLKYPNLIVNSATTVTRENVQETDATVSALAETRLFDENLICLVRDPNPERELSEAEFAIYERAIRKFVREGKARPGLRDKLLRRIYLDLFSAVETSFKRKSNTFDCLAGRRMANLDELGNLSVCEIMEDAVLGNLREHDYDPRKILKLEASRKKVSRIGTGSCNCHWECAASGAVLFSLQGKVAVLQGLLKELLPG